MGGMTRTKTADFRPRTRSGRPRGDARRRRGRGHRGSLDQLQAGAGAGDPRPDPRDGLRALACDRVVQPRERPARPDRRGPRVERASPRGREIEPHVAQAHIAKRLRALYINGDAGGAVEVILGAKSLDDLLDRARHGPARRRPGLEGPRGMSSASGRRSRPDGAKLRSARERQAQVVGERAAQRRSIESQLAERQRLLASVKDEIERLEAAERAQQAELERAGASAARGSSGGPRVVPPGVGRGRRAIPLRRRSPTTAASVSAPCRPRSTAASSGSRCSTSASRTSGAARARRGSTAPAS